MSNQTNSSTNNCWQVDLWLKATSNALFVSYNIILPSYAIFGFLGHLLFLIAIYKEYKKEKSFAYQLFVTISETVEIIFFILFSLARMPDIRDNKILWYRKVYFFVWYSAHAAIPLVNGLMTTTLLLSVSMAADRVFLLVSPIKYIKINKKCHQKLAVIICLSIGLSVNLYNSFLFTVRADQDGYKIENNYDFISSATGLALTQVSNFIRLFGLLSLIICNITIVLRYKKRFSKIISSPSNRQSVNHEKEKHQQQIEKTLILLTGCQSFFSGIATFSLISLFAAVYIKPTFNLCEGLLLAPVMNMILMLTATCNFYAAIAISKQFRKMVSNILYQLWKKIKDLFNL